MQKVNSLEEIETHAENLQKANQQWHFHILTSECKFNDSAQYAFVLESSSSKKTFIHYCSDKPTDLGKKLVTILHGDSIFSDSSDSDFSHLSNNVQEIIKRIEELSCQGKSWHHHTLFPDCVYNPHPGQWTIMFEDPENGQILENISSEEPKAELRAIEILYYSQFSNKY